MLYLLCFVVGASVGFLAAALLAAARSADDRWAEIDRTSARAHTMVIHPRSRSQARLRRSRAA